MPTRRRAVVLAAALSSLGLLSLGGCSFMRSAKAPMPAHYHAGLGAAAAHGLVVFLPGFGDTPATFLEKGLVDATREVAPGWDMAAVDAHFGYYKEGTFRERLAEDIIGPAVSRGYKEIWIVGTSMGGLGALAYAEEHPEHVTGLVLLSPYMGPTSLIDELLAAGGVAAWKPGDLESIKDPQQRLYREVWAWLQGYATGDDRPSAWLGWGDQDKLKRANQVLAKELPEDHALEAPGEHAWTTWLPLYRELATRALKR